MVTSIKNIDMDVNMASTATTPLNPNPPSMFLPTLASTLLIHEQEERKRLEERGILMAGQKDGAERGTGSGLGSTWGFRTGVDRVDGEIGKGVFSCGRVTGFGGVAEIHPQSLSLIHNLISTHIIETNIARPPNTPVPPSHSPTIFILEPPTTPSTTASLLQIYALLEKHISNHRTYQQQRHVPSPPQPAKPTTLDADTLINQTNILPYFDLIGISQALTEISESIRESHAQTTDVAAPNSVSTTTTSTTPKILLLRSLGPTLAQQLSQSANSSGYSAGSSGATGSGGSGTSVNTRIFASLGQVLGQLKRLARSCGGSRVLVLVEVGVESTRVGSGGSGYGSRVGGRGGNGVDTLALRSSFSSFEGEGLRLGLDVGEAEARDGRVNASGRKAVARGNELAARLVEDTLDGVVVLHDGFGVVERGSLASAGGSVKPKCILEVVKDKSGGNVGRWAVWGGS